MRREKPYGRCIMIASCTVFVLLAFLPTSVLAKDKVDPAFYQAICALYRITNNNSPSICDPYTPTNKRVFVTSTQYDGALGGLSGADNICQTHAEAAGLSGIFKAWLSAESSASDRLAHSTTPYVNVNAAGEIFTVANNWDELTSTGCPDDSPSLVNHIQYDEWGVLHEVSVWTNTSQSGHSLWDGPNDINGDHNGSCNQWTTNMDVDKTQDDWVFYKSETGFSTDNGAGWTEVNGGCYPPNFLEKTSCASFNSLYCFEQ